MVPSASPVQEGEIVAGKYRIEKLLGTGGMGVVVGATHLQLGQRVALKFVRPGSQNDRVIAERFLREARASFRLRSENTVRVLDVGELENGVPFMVMELLEGKDLRDILTERGPLLEDEAVEYIVQTCNALSEAHAHGIVHRDLKPRNLYLTKRVDGTPCVKVLDFGISKVPREDQSDGPLTSPEIALGSPRYMAPEQWKASSQVDARADVYALGMILYELLTGSLPLAKLPLGELLRRLVAGAIPSPKDLRPTLSDAVSKIILKALRPHPEERFGSAAALAEALRATRTPVVQAKQDFASTGLTAAHTPVRNPMPSAHPVTQREVPAKGTPEAPARSASKATREGEDATTLVSEQRKVPRLGATLQSPVVPPDMAAAVAKTEAPVVEEVRFDDPTTVDSGPRFGNTLPLSQPSPVSHLATVSPAAQSVLHPAPLPPPNASFQPTPVPPPGVATRTTRRPQPKSNTWVWIMVVLFGGFAIGGGLAYLIALNKG